MSKLNSRENKKSVKGGESRPICFFFFFKLLNPKTQLPCQIGFPTSEVGFPTKEIESRFSDLLEQTSCHTP